MATISERHQKILTLFQMSQCSWRRKFYSNEPSLCPFGRLQSSCASFEELSKVEEWLWREKNLDKIQPRVLDMMEQVVNKGTMARCRHADCGALNPNPQKISCWKCGRSLCCPQHPSILRYDLDEDSWKCADTKHGQTFGRSSIQSQTSLHQLMRTVQNVPHIHYQLKTSQNSITMPNRQCGNAQDAIALLSTTTTINSKN